MARILCTILLFFMLGSCTLEKFEDIPLEEDYKPKIVSIASINQKGILKVQITRTAQLSEGIRAWDESDLEKLTIKDALVELFEGEKILLSKKIENYKVHSFNVPDFDITKAYRISISAPNYETVYSENEIFPEPLEVKYLKKEETNSGNRKSHDFYFRLFSGDKKAYFFVENLEVGGFFLINYSSKLEFCDYIQSNINTFSNNCFKNDSLLLVLNAQTGYEYPENHENGISINFQFNSITNDYFKYLEYLSNTEDELNAFIEPFRAYSNMSNGLGIFALKYEQDFIFKF